MISDQEALDALNRVIDKYDFKMEHIKSSQFILLSIITMGYGLFLISNQEDPDILLLRLFARQHQ